MNAEVASSDTITGLFNRALTDKERVQQIQKEVDEINAMPLVSDTVSLAVLYFDKQGQLRKYFAQYLGSFALFNSFISAFPLMSVIILFLLYYPCIAAKI
jgi:hypothetical protein